MSMSIMPNRWRPFQVVGIELHGGGESAVDRVRGREELSVVLVCVLAEVELV